MSSRLWSSRIETSTGSLGHGLGVGAGLALGKGSKSTIYILVSDGELMEGSVWEMVLIYLH